MNVQELQEQLKVIIFTLPVAGNDSEKLMLEALEIIPQLKDHINDKIDKEIGTILDCILFCDTHDKKRINNAELKELEAVVQNLGGKTATAKELVQRLGISSMSIAGALSGIGLSLYLNAALESQVHRIKETLVFSSIVLTVSLPILGAVISPLAMLSRINEEQARKKLARSSLDFITQIREGFMTTSAVLGAGITGTLSRLNNEELSESLIFGLITATGVWTGISLSTTLLERFLDTPNTTIEQASVNTQVAVVPIIEFD